MSARHQIEFWMTVALVLYLSAFVVIRRSSQSRKSHITFACLGFATDMYATLLMYRIVMGGDQNFVNIPLMMLLHVALAVAAILGFFVQAGLGIRMLVVQSNVLAYWRVHDYHSSFAPIFLSIWGATYLTGVLMLL